jgi:hypothetical protein
MFDTKPTKPTRWSLRPIRTSSKMDPKNCPTGNFRRKGTFSSQRSDMPYARFFTMIVTSTVVMRC